MDRIETTVAQVGLRDFLFYVVPGVLVLLGSLAFIGVTVEQITRLGNLFASVAGLILSYLLGQFAYALSYPVREVVNHVTSLWRLAGEGDKEFDRSYAELAEKRPAYFAVEIFRYRTLARFCSLMIFPILAAWVGVVFGEWAPEMRIKGIISVLALLGFGSFLYRYYRYERRYRERVNTPPSP